MKRYALFVGESCYPTGGWEDFVAAADSIEELMARISVQDDRDILIDFDGSNDPKQWDWLQIVDLQEQRMLLSYGGSLDRSYTKVSQILDWREHLEQARATQNES